MGGPMWVKTKYIGSWTGSALIMAWTVRGSGWAAQRGHSGGGCPGTGFAGGMGRKHEALFVGMFWALSIGNRWVQAYAV